MVDESLFGLPVEMLLEDRSRLAFKILKAKTSKRMSPALISTFPEPSAGTAPWTAPGTIAGFFLACDMLAIKYKTVLRTFEQLSLEIALRTRGETCFLNLAWDCFTAC